MREEREECLPHEVTSALKKKCQELILAARGKDSDGKPRDLIKRVKN